MYFKYFGLDQPPFKITPDTRLFFPGANRGAVLEALVYAIVNGEGIVKVVGEVGSGKTMLCRMLQMELPKHVDIVYIANPTLSPEHILHAIAFELRLPVKQDDDRLLIMQALQDYLLAKYAENRRVVLFIEEAQSMPMATLEEVRLLSNLETGQDKLLQMVLFGQPELDQTLANHEIRQLKERITYSFMLTPLKGWEIRDYLHCRLRASGFHAGELFSGRAIRAIERYSQGLVRRINILADKSLLAAYAEQAVTVTPRHVEMAARDSEFIPQRLLGSWAGVAAAAVLLLAVAAGVFWLYASPQWQGGPFPAMGPDNDSAADTPAPKEEKAATGQGSQKSRAGEKDAARKAASGGASTATVNASTVASSTPQGTGVVSDTDASKAAAGRNPSGGAPSPRMKQ
ncbi:MAG: ExeA family protein [Chromatiales bacterium]